MEGLLWWLGGKAVIVAAFGVLFVGVHFVSKAILKMLPDGVLKELLSARDDDPPPDFTVPPNRKEGVQMLLWLIGLIVAGALIVWAVYEYNSPY